MREIFTWLFVGVWMISGKSMAQTDAKEDLKTEAVRQLQRKLAERDDSAPKALISTNFSTGRTLTFGEIENLYVDGKITAREFQAYVTVLRAAAPAQSPRDIETAPVISNEQESPPAKSPPPSPAITLEPIEHVPAQPSPVEERIAQDFDAIVSKMDELIKSKEARDKERGEQVTPGVLREPGSAQSKRQRLNDLLRLHIYGSLSEEEYKKKRAEIIAEPE